MYQVVEGKVKGLLRGRGRERGGKWEEYGRRGG